MLRLIIKGDEEQAQKVAKNRGLLLTHLARTSNADETVGYVGSNYMRTVQEWFTDPTAAGKVPYPPGTLLFWSVQDPPRTARI